MDSTGSNHSVDTQGLTEANPVRRHRSDAHGNPGRSRDGRHNDPRRHAALDPQANVSKSNSTKTTIRPSVSSTASTEPICTEGGSARVASEAVAGDDCASEAGTSVQGEAEPIRRTANQLSITTVIFPISDGSVVAVPKTTLSMQLRKSPKTVPVTTNLVLATKTSSTSEVITPTTFVTSFVQGFPTSISLPTEFHDQVPAGQVQQQGKGKDQYSLATGQVIVAVFVLVGVGKVVEHFVKKAWSTIVSRSIEEADEAVNSIVEPHPLVQERPTSPTPETISEEPQQEYAATTQLDHASEEWEGAQFPGLAPSSNQMTRIIQEASPELPEGV